MTRADTKWFVVQSALSMGSLAVLVWCVTIIMKPPLAPPAPAPVVVTPIPAPALDRTLAFSCGFLAGRAAILRELKLPGEVLGSDECPDQAAVNSSLARAK